MEAGGIQIRGLILIITVVDLKRNSRRIQQGSGLISRAFE